MKAKGNIVKKYILPGALCVLLAAGLLGAGIGIGYRMQPKAEPAPTQDRKSTRLNSSHVT